MLVKSDGSIVGTVGGGILEAKVQALAKQMLTEHRAAIESYKFNGKDAATMNAICGGEVEVLVEWMDGKDPLTRAIIEGLKESLNQHHKAWLVTVLPAGAATTHHVLIRSDETIVGELLSGLTLETVRGTRILDRSELNEQQIVIQTVNIAGTVYIFGAGHVSRSLAEFVKAVGFWTVILDDRADFANRERFPKADELIVLDSFSNALATLPVDRNSFIVIVTRGHLNDRAVLAQALKTEAGYIGMIGSKRKCGLIYQELLKAGFTTADFQHVHAPIGIAIDAETPEEIGISIVAEMIQARAKMQK